MHALEELQEIEETDTSPNAALRRLEGKIGASPIDHPPAHQLSEEEALRAEQRGQQTSTASLVAEASADTPLVLASTGSETRQEVPSPTVRDVVQLPPSKLVPSPLIDIEVLRELLEGMEMRARVREGRIEALVQEASLKERSR